MIPRHILLAIRNDDKQNKLLSGVDRTARRAVEHPRGAADENGTRGPRGLRVAKELRKVALFAFTR